MKKEAEQLFDCPKCGRGNFTRQGLAHHRCKAEKGGLKPVVRASQEVIDVGVDADGATGTQQGAWERVRRFVEGARLFQRASLAAQIMAGFGLAELHKVYEGRGRRNDRNLPHDVGSWHEAVKRELGISDQTAYRFMEMAKAARPRLTKGDIDLGAILAKNPAALTAAEQELLKTAVHKISDGKTQLEFLLECGVTKAPQGSGARGGDTSAHRRQLTPDEEARAQLEFVEEWTGQLCLHLTEALEKKWFNAAGDETKRRLQGLLIDLGAAVREGLAK